MSNLGRTIKTYVQVDVEFSDRGIMRPKGILWEDGQYFEIDKVLDIRSAPAAKAGGQGDRYTIRLGGQTTFLFFEHNTDYGSSVLGRWFVERKQDTLPRNN